MNSKAIAAPWKVSDRLASKQQTRTTQFNMKSLAIASLLLPVFAIPVIAAPVPTKIDITVPTPKALITASHAAYLNGQACEWTRNGVETSEIATATYQGIAAGPTRKYKYSEARSLAKSIVDRAAAKCGESISIAKGK